MTQDTNYQQQAGVAQPRYITDRELAPLLRVSVGFLQKDRITAQRIPFVRLGDRCIYDVDEVMAAVRAQTVGGGRGRRLKREQAQAVQVAPPVPPAQPLAAPRKRRALGAVT